MGGAGGFQHTKTEQENEGMWACNFNMSFLALADVVGDHGNDDDDQQDEHGHHDLGKGTPQQSMLFQSNDVRVMKITRIKHAEAP
jgi:hypothetical protein